MKKVHRITFISIIRRWIHLQRHPFLTIQYREPEIEIYNYL